MIALPHFNFPKPLMGPTEFFGVCTAIDDAEDPTQLTGQRRTTITLNLATLALADKMADSDGTSRSQLIEKLINNAAKRRKL